MRRLDIVWNGPFEIVERLEDGELPTVQSKTQRSHFDSSMHDEEESGGFGVEGEKGGIGKPSLIVSHGPLLAFAPHGRGVGNAASVIFLACSRSNASASRMCHVALGLQ